MSKEQKFYKALQDIFIGAKVEGKGGFINLMRIKAGYYSQIEKLLKRDINEAVKAYPSFREEMFDKLYSFFSRYFTESGSIYFNSTPFHNNIYEKVYTDEKDVILFWKTQMLYYVKTDRIFRSIPVEFEDLKFYFDASGIETKKANEKRALIFELDKIREDKTIVFTVKYSERGTKTKSDEILRDIKKKISTITEEKLEKAFGVFGKQSEVDFFINKNAKTFLQEQFKLWSYQYFWDGANEWSADRVNQLQILKSIAFQVIDFIGQFEDELVKIWNKPKFVRKSNYVITLDRISDDKLVDKILKHNGIKEQIKEWQELGIADENFKVKDIDKNDKYAKLPIDTKYFKDLELDILALFDDLDNQLDGWLIKSENYQALNTILPKFKEKVQTIYIDPPYNTENDEFLYMDRFKHSSWMSLLENRLQAAKSIMQQGGAIFVSIDDREQSKLTNLMMQIFGEENFINQIIWQKKFSPQNDAKWLSDNHDYIICFANNKDLWKPSLLIRTDEQNSRYQNLDNDSRGVWMSSGLDVKTYSAEYDYPIQTPSGRIVNPPKGRCWRCSKDRFKELVKDSRIWFGPDGKNVPRIKRFLTEVKMGTTPLTVWTYEEVGHNQEATQELKNIGYVFSSPKPVRLIQKVIHIGSKPDSICLDFFAGSGTTAHSIMKLNKEDGGNRKFILTEISNYFDSIIVSRIKKTAYSFDWKDGKPKDSNGIGGFFKYYELEQYEESLDKCKYGDCELLDVSSENPYQDYVFLKDDKMLDAIEIDIKNKAVKVDLDKLYPDIDIAETLSNITGKWIRKIKADSVEFADGSVINTKDLDYRVIKPLIWW